MVIVKLGAESYRQGKVFHFDREKMRVLDGNPSWAAGWEAMSRDQAKPHHLPGWSAGDKGSTLYPQEYQSLAGDWIDGVDPAKRG
jgi:hypothetical protein